MVADGLRGQTIGKGLDEKLREAFKHPPRRPNGSADQLRAEMEAIEKRRTTTSMPLAEEKKLLRDIEKLKEQLGQSEENAKFQAWIDATKAERASRFQQNKEMETQLVQLQAGVKKLSLAVKLGVASADFVSLEVPVPEDRMGAVIGKQFTNLRQLEQKNLAILEVDDKAGVVRITSAKPNAAQAKAAIENITLATNHVIGLHPDAIKVLMFQQAKNLQELQRRLGVNIDINKAEGVLTVNASPVKAKELEKAVKDLTESKVDIPLPTEIVPKLIGKKGETINQLMEDSGALVDIDKVANSVRLCGTKASVAKAKAFVLELIDAQSRREQNFTPADTSVFPWDGDAYKFEFFCEFLMQNKAEQLQVLRTDADDARIKVFKKEKRIHVLGNKAQLKAMEDALRARVSEFESHHWVYEVQDHHLLSLIIGKKGSKIKELETAGNATASEADGEDGATVSTKKSSVRIDIQGDFVCVLGDKPEAIEMTKAKIMEIVDQNQRSFFLTSQNLVTVLVANKRAKVNEIEASSGCKVFLPPPPSNGGSRNKTRSTDSDQVKISLTGTLEAIQSAKRLLEEIDEANSVRFVPLDEDEVPTVIGSKGSTISKLEATSGAKFKVLREADGPAELEMIGTAEQLDAAQREIDALLQTSNRQLLQLDPFATGCLIGKKGERIKSLRAEHPEVTVDAFPNRGQVRIKASSPEKLQECVEHVLRVLRETQVVESVHVPSGQQQQQAGGKASAPATAANFHTILQKNAAIAMRLQELEAEGGEGMKVSIQEDGRHVKIRGPAMGVGALKKFLDMLVAPDALFVETIALPSFTFAGALADKNGALNENATRICKQTGCELRVKRPAAGVGGLDDGVVRIEGTNAAKVYEAKAAVENVLQFYYSDCVQTLDKLPQTAVPRLYELLPSLRASFRVFFSLPSKTSLKVWSDSKEHTAAAVARVKEELALWQKRHVELPVAAWLVPLLLGKSGETINKLSAESGGARLDLGQASATGGKSANRVLTISARDDETVALAVENVRKLLAHHENLTAVVDVSKDKLDLALSVRKEAAKGVQFHVVDVDEQDARQVVIYCENYEERERLSEKMAHVVATSVVEALTLPAELSHSVRHSVIGALIGKGGANIRALQTEFPDVVIDIKREDSAIALKGPSSDVARVRRVVDDKIQELVRKEDEFQQQRRGRYHHEEEEEAAKPAAAATTEAKKTESESSVELADENAAPNSASFKIPVGGTPGMAVPKLNKNQRRRMRKRAENEQQNNVLDMLVGGPTTTTTTTTTTTKTKGKNGVATTSTTSTTTTKKDESGGYYHSSSGYSLRL